MPRYKLALSSALMAYAALALTPVLRAQDKPDAIPAAAVFVAKPYLQLGRNAALAAQNTLAVVWQTADIDARWTLEVKTKSGEWVKMDKPTMRRVAVTGIDPHRVYSATARDLTPGEKFEYRLSKNDKVVFQATGQARKPADTPYRFVAFGDCADNTPAQKQVAYQTYLLKPDFVLITGDIVYKRGTHRRIPREILSRVQRRTARPGCGRSPHALHAVYRRPRQPRHSAP